MLQKEKKVALVLGGTNPHIELIENLKSRGYLTVLIDYLDNPPAKKSADQHIKESTLDPEKVLAIAKDLDAKLVISTCIDQANVTACYVAEKLNLPSPYSYDTALKVTNKGLMKSIMLEHGIPTSKFESISSVEEFCNTGLSFPVVVKPMDSNGSKGVRLITKIAELGSGLSNAQQISRSNQTLIEEFKDGVEIQADFYVQSRTAQLIMVRKKNKLPYDGKSVMQSVGSIIPSNISDQAIENLKNIADKISIVFELKNTPLFIQAIIDEDDVSIIEFAPRVGGGVSYKLVRLVTGFDILDSAINSFLGISSTVNDIMCSEFYSSGIIYANVGLFGRIVGYEYLIKNSIIEEYFEFLEKGMQVDSDLSARSRVGAFIVKSNTREGMLKKMRIAIDSLEVLDVEGKPIMRKDIYEGLEDW